MDLHDGPSWAGAGMLGALWFPESCALTNLWWPTGQCRPQGFVQHGTPQPTRCKEPMAQYSLMEVVMGALEACDPLAVNLPCLQLRGWTALPMYVYGTT